MNPKMLANLVSTQSRKAKLQSVPGIQYQDGQTLHVLRSEQPSCNGRAGSSLKSTRVNLGDQPERDVSFSYTVSLQQSQTRTTGSQSMKLVTQWALTWIILEIVFVLGCVYFVGISIGVTFITKVVGGLLLLNYLRNTIIRLWNVEL
jgi:hypothetical protein